MKKNLLVWAAGYASGRAAGRDLIISLEQGSSFVQQLQPWKSSDLLVWRFLWLSIRDDYRTLIESDMISEIELDEEYDDD